MNKNIPRLLSTMDEEIDAYRKMQVILSDEKDAATLSDRERLLMVGRKKQAAVERLAGIEAQRRQIVDTIRRKVGVDDHPVTIRRLCPHLDANSASLLKARAKTLKALMETVQKANHANAQLINHYLGLIHGALKMLNETVYGRFVYHRPGSLPRTHGYAGGCGNVFCGDI